MIVINNEREKVKIRRKNYCEACGGNGYLTPLLNAYGLRNCSLCGGKGFVLPKQPETPAKGLCRRFKTFLGF